MRRNSYGAFSFIPSSPARGKPRWYRAFLLFIGLLLLPLGAFPLRAQEWTPDTIRIGGEGPGYVYTMPDADAFVARIDVPDGAILDGVAITLTGDDPNGSAVVTVLGDEGGAPVPRWGRELWPGERATKTRPGPQRLTINPPTETHIRGSQIFVVVSGLTKGTGLVTDRSVLPPACEWGGDVFAAQMIRSKEGSWQRGPFAFAVMVSLRRPNALPEPWLVEATEGVKAFDLELSNRSIAVADYDRDGYNDILAGGRLWRNMGGSDFAPVELSFGAEQSPRLHMFADIDADGDLDIVATVRSEGETEDQVVILARDGARGFAPPKYIGAHVGLSTAMSAADVNGDGRPDILISSSSPATPRAVALLSSLGSGDIRYRLCDSLPTGIGRGCRWLRGPDSTWSAAVLDASGTWRVFGLNSRRGSASEAEAARAIPSVVYPAVLQTWSAEVSLLTGYSVPPADERGVLPSGVIVQRPGEAATPLPNPYLFSERQAGLASADIDGDGRLDLVTLTSHPCYPIRAYSIDEKGGLEDVTARSGLAGVKAGPDALFADLDGDGAAEMLTLSNGRIRYFRNVAGRYVKKGPPLDDAVAIDLHARGRAYRLGQVSGHGQGMQQPLGTELAAFIGHADSAFVIASDGSRRPLWQAGRSHATPADAPTSLESALEPLSLLVSPNPSRTTVYVRLSNASATIQSIDIYDAEGTRVATLSPSGGSEIVWDALDHSGRPIPSGTYTAVAHLDDGRSVSERLTRIR